MSASPSNRALCPAREGDKSSPVDHCSNSFWPHRVAFLQNHRVNKPSSVQPVFTTLHFNISFVFFFLILAFLCKIRHNHLSHLRNLLQMIVLLLLLSMCYIICVWACGCVRVCVHGFRLRSSEGVPPHLFTIRAC